MTHSMTDARLIELIETWGADPASWPEADKAAGKMLLAAHPERFSETIAQARQLDLMLGALPEPEMPAALAQAIMNAAPRPKRAGGGLYRWFDLKTPWAPASGLAAAAVGLLMGLTIAPAASADDEVTAEVQELVVSALGFDPATYAVEDVE